MLIVLETLVNFGLSLDMLSYEAGEYISKFVSIAMSLSFEDLSETTYFLLIMVFVPITILITIIH
eukprot:Pgem_evm2s3058